MSRSMRSIDVRVSRFHRKYRSLIGSAIVCVCLISLTGLHADDRVMIQVPGQSSRITVVGNIVDFNGRELILRTGVGAGEKRFPAADVVEVSTNYLPEHQAGLKLLADGRTTEAWSSLASALEEEPRAWVRREILAAQVKCALWSGDLEQAATRFLAIVTSDELSPHYRLMPLVWTESPPSKFLRGDAQRWLQGRELPAKLLAASWLLSDPAATEEALAALNSLASEPHPYIQRYAQAQLWRVRLDRGVLSTAEIRRWEQLTENLSPNLRGGPYFLIGRAYAERQDWLSAAAAWMWLPLEYREQRYLAVEAQWRAAQALQAAGDTVSARQLAYEITVRFADAPQAVEANALVQMDMNRDNPKP
ncbi:hypothetical protein GC163_01800 [bacterium]|nr:hypothetical protein [bacterium]